MHIRNVFPPSTGFAREQKPHPIPDTKLVIVCPKMVNFWALSAIAAFCLEGVVSDNFGQPVRLDPNMNIQSLIVPGSGPRKPPGLGIPMLPLGDNKIRIACITFLSTEFFLRSFSSRRLIMEHSIPSPNASRSTAPLYVRARTGFWQMGTSMSSRVIRLTVNRKSTGSQNGGIRGIFPCQRVVSARGRKSSSGMITVSITAIG